MDQIEEAVAKLRKKVEQFLVENEQEAKSHLDIIEFVELADHIVEAYEYDLETAVKLILSYEVYKQIHNG